MFYLLVGLLLGLYYIFVAPKTIKGTLNTVLVVGVIALLLVLAFLGVLKVMQSPPEVFVSIFMCGLGAYILRDVLQLRPKTPKK